MNKRAVRLREADPSADRELILGVLRRNLPEAASGKRYEWLYLGNPCGTARAWLAEDAETGEVVGTSAAHPRQVRVEGRVVNALCLGDFAIDAAYRSLGPALSLLKATLEPIRGGEYAFSFDFPSESMLALHRRAGGVELAKSRRSVRLLAMAPALRRRWGDHLVSRAVGGIANAALRVRDALARTPGGLRVAVQEEIGGEFDELDRKLADRFPVQGVRSAAFVRWRYAEHTEVAHEILCARRAAELAGYAILRLTSPDVVSLVDCFAPDDADVHRALLVKVVRRARELGADAVSATAPAGSPAADLLDRLGFVARELQAGPVVVAAGGVVPAVQKAQNWWMLEGDRDV